MVKWKIKSWANSIQDQTVHIIEGPTVFCLD